MRERKVRARTPRRRVRRPGGGKLAHFFQCFVFVPGGDDESRPISAIPDDEIVEGIVHRLAAGTNHCDQGHAPLKTVLDEPFEERRIGDRAV